MNTMDSEEFPPLSAAKESPQKMTRKASRRTARSFRANQKSGKAGDGTPGGTPLSPGRSDDGGSVMSGAGATGEDLYPTPKIQRLAELLEDNASAAVLKTKDDLEIPSSAVVEVEDDLDKLGLDAHEEKAAESVPNGPVSAIAEDLSSGKPDEQRETHTDSDTVVQPAALSAEVDAPPASQPEAIVQPIADAEFVANEVSALIAPAAEIDTASAAQQQQHEHVAVVEAETKPDVTEVAAGQVPVVESHHEPHVLPTPVASVVDAPASNTHETANNTDAVVAVAVADGKKAKRASSSTKAGGQDLILAALQCTEANPPSSVVPAALSHLLPPTGKTTTKAPSSSAAAQQTAVFPMLPEAGSPSNTGRRLSDFSESADLLNLARSTIRTEHQRLSSLSNSAEANEAGKSKTVDVKKPMTTSSDVVATKPASVPASTVEPKPAVAQEAPAVATDLDLAPTVASSAPTPTAAGEEERAATAVLAQTSQVTPAIVEPASDNKASRVEMTPKIREVEVAPSTVPAIRATAVVAAPTVTPTSTVAATIDTVVPLVQHDATMTVHANSEVDAASSNWVYYAAGAVAVVAVGVSAAYFLRVRK